MSAFDRWLEKVLALAVVPCPEYMSFTWLTLERGFVEHVDPSTMATQLRRVQGS
jgi:hypothetical protein